MPSRATKIPTYLRSSRPLPPTARSPRLRRRRTAAGTADTVTRPGRCTATIARLRARPGEPAKGVTSDRVATSTTDHLAIPGAPRGRWRRHREQGHRSLLAIDGGRLTSTTAPEKIFVGDDVRIRGERGQGDRHSAAATPHQDHVLVRPRYKVPADAKAVILSPNWSPAARFNPLPTPAVRP